LYGRLPYDDFLFSTSVLADPNLLKRTFVETVVSELPDVLGNFRRRKRLNELLVIGSGFTYFAIGIMLVGVLYRSAMDSIAKKAARDDLGYSTSAISKKGPRKGKQIAGMAEGWVDMEVTDDDGDAEAENKGKGKGGKGDKGKGKKNRDDDDDDDEEDGEVDDDDA